MWTSGCAVRRSTSMCGMGSAPSRRPLPPEFARRAFAVAEGRDAGLSEWRLHGSDLSSPFHGVRVAGEPGTLRDLALAYLPRLHPPRVFAAETAAALYGLPLPYRADTNLVIQVGVPRGVNRPTGRNLRPRIIRPDLFAVDEVDGVPLTSPALTWCLLAAGATKEELVRFGDALVSRRDYFGRVRGFVPLALDDLLTAVDRWARCDGVANLRAALPWVRENVASPPESDLRMQLLAAGLPEPEINVELHDPAGRWLACVDALYRDRRLVFEYEGDGHRTDRAQWRKDIRRIGGIQDASFRVVRVTGDDLYRQPRQFRQRAKQVYDHRRTGRWWGE